MKISALAGVTAAIATFLLMGCQPPEGSLPAATGPAQRIVSLAPHITELTYAAGAGESLVGVVDYSDYPSAALEVPRIGDAFRVDYERLNALQPDLVLAWQSGNPAEIITRLRTLNYRVVELEPAFLDDISEQIIMIGNLAGTEATANERAAELQAQLQSLREQHRDLPIVSVFYQIAVNPYFTITEKHVINDALTLCGGRNVFAGVAGLAPAISLEAIIAADPQVIIASVSADDVNWKSSWQRWSSMQAVQNSNLFGIDRDLISRSGPRIIAGVSQICAALEEARARQ